MMVLVWRSVARDRPVALRCTCVRSRAYRWPLRTVRGPLARDLEAQVEKLRDEGHIVVRLLPGERDEDVLEQFVITKELVRTSSGFELKAL